MTRTGKPTRATTGPCSAGPGTSLTWCLVRPWSWGSEIGNYLAKVVAWDFEASDDDPTVVLDLLSLSPQAVKGALARTRFLAS